MKERKLTAKWTKTGDAVALQREVKWATSLPARPESDENIVDLLLAIPGSWQHVEVEYEQPKDTPPVIEDAAILARLLEEARLMEETAKEERRAQEALGGRMAGAAVLMEWVYNRGDKPGWVRTYGSGDNREYHGTLRDALAHLPDQHRELADELLRQHFEEEDDRETRDLAEQKEAAAAKEEEKARASERRAVFIATWAHGADSGQLIEQLRQGLDGWPRFLHEKLEHDLGEIGMVELDNDGTDCSDVADPTMEQLAKASQVAAVAVSLGMFNTVKEAHGSIAIRPITKDVDDEADPYEEPETEVYVILHGYRPGPEEIGFKVYRVRFLIAD